MPTEVIMPALGMAQETGVVVGWKKRPGDSVAKGEPLLVVETDKAVVEVEAPASGTLARVSAPEGAEVPGGQPIALILAEGEGLPAAAAVAAPGGDETELEVSRTWRIMAERTARAWGSPHFYLTREVLAGPLLEW